MVTTRQGDRGFRSRWQINAVVPGVNQKSRYRMMGFIGWEINRRPELQKAWKGGLEYMCNGSVVPVTEGHRIIDPGLDSS